jgi:hypothetical protein
MILLSEYVTKNNRVSVGATWSTIPFGMTGLGVVECPWQSHADASLVDDLGRSEPPGGADQAGIPAGGRPVCPCG